MFLKIIDLQCGTVMHFTTDFNYVDTNSTVYFAFIYCFCLLTSYAYIT